MNSCSTALPSPHGRECETFALVMCGCVVEVERPFEDFFWAACGWPSILPLSYFIVPLLAGVPGLLSSACLLLASPHTGGLLPDSWLCACCPLLDSWTPCLRFGGLCRAPGSCSNFPAAVRSQRSPRSFCGMTREGLSQLMVAQMTRLPFQAVSKTLWQAGCATAVTQMRQMNLSQSFR